MPNTSSSKKSSNEHNASSQKNTSGGSTSTNASRRSRKRKRKSQEFDSDWENELEGCNLQDAVEMEAKLRSVAQKNSLSEEEMRKILQKLVKNDHILALVSLQTEDEMAREREAGKAAPDSPAVLKLTRAKARELNKTPGITLPSLADPPQPEIAALIKEDLHSDDDDEEYMFKEEDFMSDDDPNTTDDPNTDLDSNPCTPKNSTCLEDSPVKFTPDGCFKVPLEKPKEDLRIATRTRSKLCLEQTTIEDLQSEFVPPDVEQMDPLDMTVIDEDWMQFLNDFTKPMNSSIVADEDDPINDPEYVGADTLPVDAEELRDVNISKKELTELLAELFEGLFSEHPSMESVDLETPQKFLSSHAEEAKTPETSATWKQSGTDVARRLDFNDTTLNSTANETLPPSGADTSFRPDVVSTPSVQKPVAEPANDETLSVAVANTSGTPLNLGDDPDLIAVPVAGQPNCFQLAKILSNEYIKAAPDEDGQPQDGAAGGQRKRIFDIPSWIYISIRKHYFAEYAEKFERLRHIRVSPIKAKALEEKTEARGFSHWQYQMLQQQLCMHVQMLTQTFLQTYCHTQYWKFAPKAKKFLLELHEKAAEHATFNSWNLQPAVRLVTGWEEELSVDNEENQKLVDFFRREINLTNKNTRQVPRFSPRIMDVFLNNPVFMYPHLLPRIPFVSRQCQYHCFAPTESQLVAMGLEYHLGRVADGTVTLSRKASPLLYACEQMTNKLVFGKTKRRIFDYVRQQRKESTYNPIQYYYEHKRAPPINNVLYSFANNVVLPPMQRFHELPLIFQEYVNKQNTEAVKPPRKGVKRKCPSSSAAAPATTKPEKVPKVSARARDSYVAFVREALGDEITLPDNCIAAEPPDGSFTEQRSVDPATPVAPVIVQSYQQKHNKNVTYSTVVLNLNYKLEVSASPEKKQSAVVPDVPATPIVTYDYDYESGTVVQLNDGTEPSTRHELNTSTGSLRGQRKITDFLTVVKKDPSVSKDEVSVEDAGSNQPADITEPELKIELCSQSDTSKPEEPKPSAIVARRPRRRVRKVLRRYRTSKEISRCWRRKLATAARLTPNPANHCLKYLDSLLQKAAEDRERYASAPLVQFYYRHFRAFEKFTELLRMFSRHAASGSNGIANGSSNSPQNTAKRPRTSGDSSGGEEPGGSSNGGVTPKKVNRKEENYRQMLLPDAPEDINRRDSTFALQFYKKVADTFRSDNEIEKFNEFDRILRSFDPDHDQSHDLYFKVQKLFLPNHPELADSFLIFFLPEEANAIGKFLEHFLVTNMEAFIQKLKKYFHKQPVQLRKIFACLEELSDTPDLTMEHMKSRLVPLLKGNTILLDYFTQLFPEEAPPKSSMPSAEHVNFKYEKRNNEGDSVETINDMPDSPNTDHTACSLKYINGRIYNGPKMTLPAKLSFMAESVHENLDDAEISVSPTATCAHGIYSEPRKTPGFDDSDYDSTKVLVIDSSGDGDNSSSTHSVEACDEATLRSHAMRLNPAHYNAAYYTSLDAANHVNAKRAASHHHNNNNNNNDEGKSSPRKANGTAPSSPNVTILMNSPTAIYSVNDSSSSSSSVAAAPSGSARRKSSPQKRLKSPNAAPLSSLRQRLSNPPPMVVIHKGHLAAVEQAKKLKAFIETSDSECGGQQQQPIVARTKNMVVSSMKSAKREEAPTLPQVNEEATTSNRPLTTNEDIKVSLPSQPETTTAPVAVIKEQQQQQPQELPAKDNETTWNREEDKIILIEMQKGATCAADELCQRIAQKLQNRSLEAIRKRYQFLVDTVKKVQKTS